MEHGPGIYFPMDVGQRIILHLAKGRVWSVVRGWKDFQAVLVDVPNTQELSMNLDPTTPCLIRYSREGILHSFKSEILGVLSLPPSLRLLGVQYPRRVDSQSLRSAPRIKLRIPARIVRPDGRTCGCVVMDLSQNGCQVRSPEFRLKPGDALRLSCLLPNQKTLSDVPCVVRRSYDMQSYGMEFQRMSKTQHEAVDNFLGIFASFQSMEGAHEDEKGMIGDLEEVSLPDLLQILASSGKTYQVDLTDAPRWGVIYVDAGAVRYARNSEQEDPATIFDLLSWPKGRYRVQRVEGVPERNLDMRLEQLLLEFAFRRDQESLSEEMLQAESDED